LVHLADLSGHGLQDLVRLRSGRVEYWPSLGHGRFGRRVSMLNSPRLRDLERDPDNTFLADVDGDGCADLVRVSASGVAVYFNQNGVRFSEAVVFDTVPSPLPGTARPVNMSGRARTGLVWNSLRARRPAYVQMEFGGTAPPYLLARVSNGSGLVSELFYRFAIEDYRRDLEQRAPWRTHLPFPIAVVAGSTETDQVTGQVTETEYRYHEGHFDPRTRQFQGFGRAERSEKGDESRPDALTVFHYVMAEERQPGNGPEHAALNGLQRRTEVFALDGSARQDRPYRVEECDHELRVLSQATDGRHRVFVSVRTHRLEDSERTDDLRGEEKTYTYDEFGNVTREHLRGFGRRGGVPQAERQRTTEIEYARGTTRWIVDRPARIVVRDETGTIIREKRRYYDGPAFQGLALGDITRGLLAREEQLVMSEAAFQAHYAGMDPAALGYHLAADADGHPSRFTDTERNAYGPAGVKLADRDATGNERTFVYDGDNLFRTGLTDALGETRFEYARTTGEPTRIVYADGSVARFAYDAQGRMTASALPGDDPANPPRTFTYDDVSVPHSRMARFRASGDPAGVAAAVTYFDGRGKEVQQRLEAGGGRVIVSGLSVRNPWGDVKREFQPTDAVSLAFALPAPAVGMPRREISFDGRGRAVRTVDYSGGVSLADYRPFEVILHDANDTDDSAANLARGQFDTPRREEFDVFRDRTRLVEVLGGGATAEMSFAIGPAGDLLQISDARGVLCGYTLDRLGRRLTISHREAGQRRMWYDGRGKTVRTADPNGNDLHAEIDALGRLARLTAGGTTLEQYRYDDPVQNALGRLAEVTYDGGRQRFHYDTAGRLTLHEYRFDGAAAAHTLAYEYDLLGREIAHTHTDGTRIARQLAPNGWVRAIPGFLNEVAYDPRGLPTRLVFANGVTTELTYTDGPGRVATQRTVGPGGQLMEDVSYDYDKLRMLLGQADTAPGGRGTQTFDYDPLYQLRRTTSTGGTGSVTQHYEYTDHLNLSRFDEMDSVFHYDDATHPSRLAGITRGAAPRADLGYDANGNLLELPAKTFHYNAKSELRRFEETGGVTAEYRYDHQGRRVSKTVVDANGGVVRT
ncbi:MAG: toxin TcdB middle/N-terminal domain-containing protein, partial [Nocardioidaceae bacterium]